MRAAREREREMRELERDTRTIFAYNLNLKAEDRDIYEFFSKAGKVIDVKIIMDRNTRKSKGFAYVEFENQVHWPLFNFIWVESQSVQCVAVCAC